MAFEKLFCSGKPIKNTGDLPIMYGLLPVFFLYRKESYEDFILYLV